MNDQEFYPEQLSIDDLPNPEQVTFDELVEN